MSAIISKIIPMDMVHATGTKLASGELVEMEGMDCRKPLNKKKQWITFFSCSIREMGRNDIKVYLVVFT
jgi:hypothetical protein